MIAGKSLPLRLSTLLALGVASPAAAEIGYKRPVTAGELSETCMDLTGENVEFCVGYAQAVFDFAILSGSACPKGEAGGVELLGAMRMLAFEYVGTEGMPGPDSPAMMMAMAVVNKIYPCQG